MADGFDEWGRPTGNLSSDQLKRAAESDKLRTVAQVNNADNKGKKEPATAAPSMYSSVPDHDLTKQVHEKGFNLDAMIAEVGLRVKANKGLEYLYGNLAGALPNDDDKKKVNDSKEGANKAVDPNSFAAKAAASKEERKR